MGSKRLVMLGLSGRGGTLHYSSSISSSLANFCETQLLLPTYSDTSLISKNVRLIREAAPPSAFLTILLSFNIFQHIRTIRKINAVDADVINILDLHPWYILYWPFLKAKRKIVTINDPELHSGEAGLVMTVILKRITRFLLLHADEIIVLGKKQKDALINLGYNKKIIVSRIGSYSFFKTKSKTRFEVEPRTMLFFGRIKDYKGLDYLLDACIELKKEGKKFRLIIAGEGDIKKYEKKLAVLKGYVKVHSGYVPDENVFEYFQRCSFVVMPYTDATQTGVVQVASSFSKPVIATNVGSLPEIVVNNNTGIIIEPKDSKELYLAMIRLLDNPKLARSMGNKAYSFGKKNLDWKIIGKKLFADMF